VVVVSNGTAAPDGPPPGPHEPVRSGWGPYGNGVPWDAGGDGASIPADQAAVNTIRPPRPNFRIFRVGGRGVCAVLGGAVTVVGDFVLTRRLGRGGSVDVGLKLGAGPAWTDSWWGRHGGVLPVASLVFARHF
jgi:hypothetical protein